MGPPFPFVDTYFTFIALYNALDERRYDLAVMRTPGARPITLILLLLFEGLLLVSISGVPGIAVGDGLTQVRGRALETAQQVSVTGHTRAQVEWWVLALAAGVGIVAALLPA